MMREERQYKLEWGEGESGSVRIAAASTTTTNILLYNMYHTTWVILMKGYEY